MRKLSQDVENSIIGLTEKGCSSRIISSKLGISQSVVIRVQKRRKVSVESPLRGRPRLLNDADARHIMANMRKDKFLTPKGASLEINKDVSRWTARRALQRIGYVAAVKKINLRCRRKM